MAKTRDYRDESLLRELYIGEGLTQVDIAERFDVSQTTVSNWMGKYGLKTREADPGIRFEQKYEVDDETGCHVWTGCLTRNGYGKFWMGDREIRAHRAAYILKREDFNRDLYVLHKCDNPPCVNPNHLYLGNQQQNVNDAIERGDFDNRGSKCGTAKLTRDDVLLIYSRIDDGVTHAKISDEFGISVGQVSRIRNGERWSHLYEEVRE